MEKKGSRNPKKGKKALGESKLNARCYLRELEKKPILEKRGPGDRTTKEIPAGRKEDWREGKNRWEPMRRERNQPLEAKRRPPVGRLARARRKRSATTPTERGRKNETERSQTRLRGGMADGEVHGNPGRRPQTVPPRGREEEIPKEKGPH